MAWIRLDDQIAHHPKFVQAGPVAAWLWVCGQSYSARYLTDGFIPRDALSSLGTVPHADKAAAKLVAVGLWDATEKGWLIHDYHDYQLTKEEVERRREDRRKAGRLGGRRAQDNQALAQALARAAALAGAPIDTPGTDATLTGANGVAKPNPVPVPVPVEIPPNPPRGDGGEGDGSAADDFWATWREIHARTQHGAQLPLVPRGREIQTLVDLVTSYPDLAHLARMAEVFMLRDDPDVRGKPKSLGLFAYHAPWCDTQLRRARMAGSAA
jgi:hypothetical protein